MCPAAGNAGEHTSGGLRTKRWKALVILLTDHLNDMSKQLRDLLNDR
jgi:hypothetical protein